MRMDGRRCAGLLSARDSAAAKEPCKPGPPSLLPFSLVRRRFSALQRRSWPPSAGLFVSCSVCFGLSPEYAAGTEGASMRATRSKFPARRRFRGAWSRLLLCPDVGLQATSLVEAFPVVGTDRERFRRSATSGASAVWWQHVLCQVDEADPDLDLLAIDAWKTLANVAGAGDRG